jgi:hypothetical protein
MQGIPRVIKSYVTTILTCKFMSTQSHAIIQYHIIFLWDYYQSNQINCLCTYGLHNDNNSKGEKNNHNKTLNHVMLPNVYKYVHWFNLGREYCEQIHVNKDGRLYMTITSL